MSQRIKVGDTVTYDGQRGVVIEKWMPRRRGVLHVVTENRRIAAWPADECELEEETMSDKDETLSVLFYEDRDAWYEAVGDRVDMLISRMDVLCQESKALREGDMSSKQMLILVLVAMLVGILGVFLAVLDASQISLPL